MTLLVRRFRDADAQAWDAFVLSHPKATFCHRAGWKRVIEKGAGHACPYLIAEEKGLIVGILPLTFRRSLLFGNALISNMFCVYGGAVAIHDQAYQALDSAAEAEMDKAGVTTAEYRSQHARHRGEKGWCVTDSKAATFTRMLADNPEDILLSIPRKQRAVVRKSIKHELVTSIGPDELDSFYRLYALSVRNLGTPVFPKKLFTEMRDAFGDDMEIVVIRTAEGRPLASLVSFYHGQDVLPYYAGGGVEARAFGAHDYMYYDLMCRAQQRGSKRFDFGRSKAGTGAYRFKKNWGFEAMPLEYEYFAKDGAEHPDLSPTNPRFQLMVACWKRLPLAVATMLGPFLARHLG